MSALRKVGVPELFIPMVPTQSSHALRNICTTCWHVTACFSFYWVMPRNVCNLLLCFCAYRSKQSYSRLFVCGQRQSSVVVMGLFHKKDGGGGGCRGSGMTHPQPRKDYSPRSGVWHSQPGDQARPSCLGAVPSPFKPMGSKESRPSARGRLDISKGPFHQE